MKKDSLCDRHEYKDGLQDKLSHVTKCHGKFYSRLNLEHGAGAVQGTGSQLPVTTCYGITLAGFRLLTRPGDWHEQNLNFPTPYLRCQLNETTIKACCKRRNFHVPNSLISKNNWMEHPLCRAKMFCLDTL